MEDFNTRNLLKTNFNYSGGYWYPLIGERAPENCEYFDEDVFVKEYGLERLILLIKKMECVEINEIAEDLKDRKIPVDDLYSYSGLEVIYCNDNVEWAIYFSHENTVTFLGTDFLQRLKNDWPSWERYKNPWKLENIA